jgi:putative ABC transport system substrate-binding protein
MRSSSDGSAHVPRWYGCGSPRRAARRRAQQPGPVHRLGILSTAEPPNRATTPSFVNTVPAILKELGYIEGQTLLIERRFAGGNPERLRQLARELVELRMDVILASGGAAVQAARNATITIPIVMGLGDDPVGRGWAASLARPGGNVTGMVSLRGSLTPKRLQLIKEAMPRRGQMALLLDTAGDWDDVQAVQQVATSIGVKLIVIEA